MNIAICDDDQKDRECLLSLIKNYGREKHMRFSIEEYASASELLAAMGNSSPDAIFLDINMEDMDGLTLAAKIRERLADVPIILVTAFINYAIDGYKVRASRFLVKDDLEKTIEECMDDVCAQLRRKCESILFSCVEGDVNLRLSEILYVEVSGHKNIIHLEEQVYHIYETMEEMEARLKGYGFVRAHQSYLVNMRHIRKINNYVLTLDNGKEISVPKPRYKQLRQEYTLYVGRAI